MRWLTLLPLAALFFAIDAHPCLFAQQATANVQADKLTALEAKLIGSWAGPACGGDLHFKKDGTFVMDHYTPGGNTISGKWSLTWDALPPTLALECTASDFKTKDAAREEFAYLGKTWKHKLLKLSDDAFVVHEPDSNGQKHYERSAKAEAKSGK